MCFTACEWKWGRHHISTYVRMAVSQQLVEDVAELPAEHRVAGERKPVDRCPESVGAFLMMGPQDAGWQRQSRITKHLFVLHRDVSLIYFRITLFIYLSMYTNLHTENPDFYDQFKLIFTGLVHPYMAKSCRLSCCKKTTTEFKSSLQTAQTFGAPYCVQESVEKYG